MDEKRFDTPGKEPELLPVVLVQKDDAEGPIQVNEADLAIWKKAGYKVVKEAAANGE